MITQKELQEILHYNPETGMFTRIKSFVHNAPLGVLTGSYRHGYRGVTIKKKSYKLHRLAWLYVCGEFPKNSIDHINQIRDDNRICNLREVDHAENNKNMPIRIDNKSGTIGVYWCSTYKKWKAVIGVGGKTISLGYHKNKEDAIKLRKEAEVKYNFHKNHGKA